MIEAIKAPLRKIYYSIPASGVLMLHHAVSSSDFVIRCGLDTDRFEVLVNEYRGHFTTLENVVRHGRKKALAITFDDGHADQYRVAYPYLRERGIPFTVFIALDFLDTPRFMTTRQMLDMANDPLVSIQSHGISHRLPDEMKPGEIKRELRESKERLEDLIGKKVSYFAYPSGQYNKEYLDSVREEYECAFAASGGVLNFWSGRNRKLLPRLGVDNKSYEYAMKTIGRII